MDVVKDDRSVIIELESVLPGKRLAYNANSIF
jgi:hypothetical protein